MSSDTLLVVLVAIVMVIGVAGTVLPLLPGLWLIWAAALAYGLVDGFGMAGWISMTLITALAVSMVLYNSVMASTSGEYKAFPVDLGYDGIEFGNVFITYTQIILVSSTAILMTVLHFFISRTMLGKAMRAIAIDQDACRLMGINVKSIIALTFFVGSALACAAGAQSRPGDAGLAAGVSHYAASWVWYGAAVSAADAGASTQQPPAENFAAGPQHRCLSDAQATAN